MIGANTITAPKLAVNSIDNTKIQDGQVTVADLAANSVDASKVRDGSIGKAEVSTTFMKKESLLPTSSGGWKRNPGISAGETFIIFDSQVSASSLVVTSLGNQGQGETTITCPVTSVDSGSFTVHCNFPPPFLGINGELLRLNYVVIN